MAWNTTVRGRKVTKRKMTNKERELYGLPLVGQTKIRAETEAINEERMMNPWKDGSNGEYLT